MFGKTTKQSKSVMLKERRKKRVRLKVSGTTERPRMSVFRSTKHVYVQVIDDLTGKTIVSASSFEKDYKKTANKEVCFEIGKRIAERCKQNKVEKIVFDKNGNQYHGRVKALADGAREGGLSF